MFFYVIVPNTVYKATEVYEIAGHGLLEVLLFIYQHFPGWAPKRMHSCPLRLSSCAHFPGSTPHCHLLSTYHRIGITGFTDTFQVLSNSFLPYSNVGTKAGISALEVIFSSPGKAAIEYNWEIQDLWVVVKDSSMILHKVTAKTGAHILFNSLISYIATLCFCFVLNLFFQIALHFHC